MQWSDMSNTEIRIKMSSMEEEYESIKNKINNLISKLDSLDNEYNNAKKELEKRNRK
jgi:hypothetical protein